MKKLLIPMLAVTLLGLGTSAPAGAWPWKKDDKAAAPKADSQDGKKDKKSKKSDDTPTASDAAPASTPADAAAAPGNDNQSESGNIPRVQVKSPLTDEINGLKVEDPVESPILPPDRTFVAVDDPKNPLGITTAAQKLNTSAQLISQKKYKEASAQLIPLKDWLVDATEAHISLYKTLKAIPSAQVQAELEKQLALQFALLRDKSFFQLGMLSIGQSDYSGAVKNLSRVIQSQPRSPMGAQAYEVLQKIGFTEKLQLKEDKKLSERGQ